ncbi:PAS domain S-box protein [Paenibacillus gansuensis]|uniref:histidine kinase n=1 Tax=Paenibacillus gansuensis TaxID=306542 RepID=A0ABW5PM52_9BACL
MIRQWYHSLLHHNPDGIMVFSRNARILSANPAAEAILGRTIHELIQCETYGELVTQEERQKLYSYFLQVIQGEHQTFSTRMLYKDGRILEIDAKLVPMVVNGQVAGCFGIFKDMTGYREAQRELLRTKDTIESFIHHSSDGIVVVDLECNIIRTNQAFCDLIDSSPSEVLGTPINSLPNYLNQQNLLDIWGHIANGDQWFNYEAEQVRSDGSIVNLDIHVSPIANEQGRVYGYAGTIYNITPRKKLECELRESREKYKLIAENMTDLICLIDDKWMIRFMSPSSAWILGYPPEKLENTLVWAWISDEQRIPLKPLFMSSGIRETILTELEFSLPDGSRIVLECNSMPLYREDGTLKYISVVARDITQRKKDQQALAEAEAKYRVLVEEALMGVYLYQDGYYLYANPRLCEMLGYTIEEISRIPVAELVFKDDLPLMEENIRLRFNEDVKNVNYSYRMVRKDGSIASMEGTGSLTTFNGKQAIIGTVMDMTERNKTEEILRKTDRLSLVGQLAAGVAHEIRNPLTSLKGFVHLLKARSKGYTEYLDIMSSELDRINYIVSEFMLVAKPQGAVQFEKKDVAAIMDQVISLLSSQAALFNVQFLTAKFTDSIFVNCDENQMKQVFINITKNAVESMPKGGYVRIEFTRQPDNRLRIRIEDQGDGIPEDRMPQVGEPFYTTKEKGTGLGLMVCYKIIQSHGGSIAINSVVHKGTVVDITLPLAEA